MFIVESIFGHEIASDNSFIRSTILEEVSVRSNIALRQKKFLQDFGVNDNDNDLEREYMAFSAQVVSFKSFF